METLLRNRAVLVTGRLQVRHLECKSNLTIDTLSRFYLVNRLGLGFVSYHKNGLSGLCII